MERYTLIPLREHGEWLSGAADWFHEKWKVPREAYRESMKECLEKKGAVPQWYLMLDGEKIIGGAGIIDNDFHDRKDLTPNLCALYVEEPYRKQGIAGRLLEYVCRDCREARIDTLYLITDHTSFYERYGWEFLCMVTEDGGGQTRMYVHRS